MDRNEIQNIIDKNIPTKEKQRLYLDIFCEIVMYADSFGSEKWGVNIKSDGIRINVGSLMTTTLQFDSIWMALDKELIKENPNELNDILSADWDTGEWSEYSAIKTQNYFYKDFSKDKWEKIKHLHFEVIKKSSQKYYQLRTDSQKGTSLELLDYLRQEKKINIPNPIYKETTINGDAKFVNTGYWIFFCNPQFWQIDDFLETDEINSTWKITEWQKDYFQEGQLAVIRVGNDSRTKEKLEGKERLKAGIYGIVEITSKAESIPDTDKEYWLTQEKHGDERLRVKIKYIKKLLDNPILLSDLKNMTDFQSEKVLLNGRQASSWSLSKEAFDSITHYAENNIELIKEANTSELYDLSDLHKLELKYSKATPRVKEIVSRRIERGDISKAVKKANNYECQICKMLGVKPQGFKKVNGEFYIETHHIIPVSVLEQGTLGTLNLLTVCPNHHRQLHYGNVKLIKNNDKLFEFMIDNKQIQIEKLKTTEW